MIIVFFVMLVHILSWNIVIWKSSFLNSTSLWKDLQRKIGQVVSILGTAWYVKHSKSESIIRIWESSLTVSQELTLGISSNWHLNNLGRKLLKKPISTLQSSYVTRSLEQLMIWCLELWITLIRWIKSVRKLNLGRINSMSRAILITKGRDWVGAPSMGSPSLERAWPETKC